MGDRAGGQGCMADKYRITHPSQRTDPKLAKPFDTPGDGKANRVGSGATASATPTAGPRRTENL